MYVATNRIRVKNETGEKLEERFKSRGNVRQQPGFLSLELWKLEQDAWQDYEEFLVVTHWESEQDFRDWTRSEVSDAAHSGPRAEFIIEHPEFKGYTIRQSSKVYQLFGKTVDLDV